MVGRSPLRAILLAAIIEQPGHGYQIAAQLRWKLGPSWRIYAKHLYPVLKELEEEGLLRSEEVPAKRARQSDKERIVYYPTPAAEAARADWMQAPFVVGLLRPDIHARLIFSRPEEAPQLLELLDEYEGEILKAIQADAPADPPPSTWQGGMIRWKRAALGRQWDGELESIAELRLDIKAFIADR